LGVLGGCARRNRKAKEKQVNRFHVPKSLYTSVIRFLEGITIHQKIGNSEKKVIQRKARGGSLRTEVAVNDCFFFVAEHLKFWKRPFTCHKDVRLANIKSGKKPHVRTQVIYCAEFNS